MSEGSVFNAAAAAAAEAMAAASSRLRLNNPGDSTASADDGKGESVGKNLEDAAGTDAAGTGAAGGAGVEVAGEAGAAGAVDLGFVKKPRMSMSQITSSRDNNACGAPSVALSAQQPIGTLSPTTTPQ